MIVIVVTAVHPTEGEPTTKESHLSLKVVYILYEIYSTYILSF